MNEPFPRLNQPSDRAHTLWGVKEMVLCVVIVLVALFVITTAIVGPFLAIYGDNAPETLTANSAANIVWNAAMIGSVLWFVRRSGASTHDLGLQIPAGSSIFGVAGKAAGTFVLMYFIVTIYTQLINIFGFDFLTPSQQVPNDYYNYDIVLAVLGLAIVISAPITEEIFFRGFLFGGTRPLISAVPAALLTGFIFSLAHFNLGLIIPFTAIGAVLALSYHRSGTLFVPMGAHFLFNLISFSILVFVPSAR